MAEFFNNAGTLFDEERLSQLPEYPEWNDEEIEDVRRSLEELLEKRQSQIDEGMDAMDTRYFWVSYVLRALGFASSVAEMTPEATEASDPRPNFTLFMDAQDFRSALPYRGSREFFIHSLAIMQALEWDASLDEVETDEGIENPALQVDRFVRSTGVEWGILTNGRIWRLFHRDSIGLLDTYFEIDLVNALESNETEAFKYFWMVFSPFALSGGGEVEPIVRRLL
ncbi:MAG: hypothetical protein ACQEVA_01805 [Myxococcota bacterium]